MISEEAQAKRFCRVQGKRMAYVERGHGFPVILLHGNPTSSYLWRNVIPLLESQVRCIAPDLIGMGDSDKLDGDDPARYGFLQHRRFLEDLLIQLGVLEDVTFVGHDWGGALATDWARRHPAATRGIAYLETAVRPREWHEIDPKQREMFEWLRSPEGEKLVLQENVFVEKVLPAWTLRTLSSAEMAEYRRPFLLQGEDRRPTLTFPREILIGGQPEHMVPIIGGNTEWMQTTNTPKLFINGDPGAIIFGELREMCRARKNQIEVTVRGRHYLPEDSPVEIGEAIARWLATLPHTGHPPSIGAAPGR